MSDRPSRCPVVFFGHGTPLNVLEDNVYTRGWAKVGAAVGRPRAILVISGHWYTRGTHVTAMERPPTIYDFGYQNMFHIKYPAPGDPALAKRIIELATPEQVSPDLNWGLDHGAWSVLVKAFPNADIPVVELSIDGLKPPSFHHELGRKLAPLRDENVLIIASGNIVHNLPMTIRRPDAPAYPWANRFDAAVRDKLESREWSALVDYPSLDREALVAVPTPDHYLPLLYAIGAADPDELIAFPTEGIDRGSMSMRSITFGLLAF